MHADASGCRGGGPGGGGGAAPRAGRAADVEPEERSGGTLRADADRFPANARVTEPYWHRAGEAGRYTFDADAPFGLPFRPTPFYLQVTLAFPGGDEVIHGLPVQYRYEGNIFSGEKRMDLLVAPAFSVSVSPEVAIIPARRRADSARRLRRRDARAAARRHTAGSAVRA